MLARNILCLVIIICLIITASVHMNITYKPSLILPIIFFFSLLRGFEPSYLGLMIVGIVDDALNSLPLGLSSLTYLLFSIMTRNNSKALLAQRFWVVWSGFAGLLLIYSAIHYSIIYFIAGHLNIVATTINLLLTVLLYPLIHLTLKHMIAGLRPDLKATNA